MESARKIKGILLDLDGVLYSYPKCNDFAKRELFKYLSQKLGKSSSIIKNNFERARKIVHHDLAGQGSSHSRLLYIQKCIEFTSGKTHYGLSLAANDFFWKKFFSVMRLRNGVIEFLQKSKKNKLKIAIVTDLIAGVQLEKIIHLKLGSYIDFLVTSEEAGAEKPAPKIFKLALQKLNLKPSNVVMIGDSSKKDITGAANLGIKTIHFSTGKGSLKLKKSSVNNFKEISEITCK